LRGSISSVLNERKDKKSFIILYLIVSLFNDVSYVLKLIILDNFEIVLALLGSFCGVEYAKHKEIYLESSEFKEVS